jgi:phage shock protein E
MTSNMTNERGHALGRDLVARGATLLDVRTCEEFAVEHVPGALNIPLQELSRRQSELGDKSAPIVVYCRSGGRSASASALLRAQGFVHVHDLGAMLNWSR